MTGLRIFMVSSDAETAFGVAKLFQKTEIGHCVGYASTESEALRWLDSHPVDWDVMIADTALDHGSGLSLLAQCPPPNPSQKTVMLSYFLTEKLKAYCQFQGADLTLDKAQGFDQLMAKMALWSEQHGGNRRPDSRTPNEHDCALACC